MSSPFERELLHKSPTGISYYRVTVPFDVGVRLERIRGGEGNPYRRAILRPDNAGTWSTSGNLGRPFMEELGLLPILHTPIIYHHERSILRRFGTIQTSPKGELIHFDLHQIPVEYMYKLAKKLISIGLENLSNARNFFDFGESGNALRKLPEIEVNPAYPKAHRRWQLRVYPD